MMRAIEGTTGVFGVIGDPVGHSFSPLMHNLAFEAMGLDCVYVAFHVLPGNLEQAVKAVSALQMQGLNVTAPHKTRVMRYLDTLSDAAKAVGAVNTIINKNGVLIGDNTDVYGFEECVLRDGGMVRFPSRICILGAGGASRAVVYACARRTEVEEIVILNRTESRAREIALDIGALTGKRIIAAPSDAETQWKELRAANMVVNATTVGMHPDIEKSPVLNPEVFHSGQTVCDIIYTPLRTRFLRDADKRGAKTIGGLSMLAYQGARSLFLWTGRQAPSEIMLEALRERFGAA